MGRQLLRLRALHLGVAPGGGAVDSVVSVRDTHAAFFAMIDTLLLEQLGMRGIQGLLPPSRSGEPLTTASAPTCDAAPSTSDVRRLGFDLLLVTAAAAALAGATS